MTKNDTYHFDDSSPLKSQAYLLLPILEFLKDKKNLSILDVGCGNGAIANHLISLGYNVYGIDGSQEGINFANTINAGRFFYCHFDDDKLPEELPYKNFDIILSTEVVEHVFSPKKYMEFINRILNPGGLLLLSTPYHGYFKNIALAIFNKMDGHYGPLWEGGHIKFWSKQTLKNLYFLHNFEVQKFIGCGRLPFLWKSMILIDKKNKLEN